MRCEICGRCTYTSISHKSIHGFLSSHWTWKLSYFLFVYSLGYSWFFYFLFSVMYSSSTFKYEWQKYGHLSIPQIHYRLLEIHQGRVSCRKSLDLIRRIFFLQVSWEDILTLSLAMTRQGGIHQEFLRVWHVKHFCFQVLCRFSSFLHF